MSSVKKSNSQHESLSKKNFFKSAKVQSDAEKNRYYAKAEYHDVVIKRQQARGSILPKSEKKQIFKSTMRRYGTSYKRMGIIN